MTSSVLLQPVAAARVLRVVWHALWPVEVVLFAVGLVIAMAAVFFLVDHVGRAPQHRGERRG